jgi:hypothetical protein
MAGEGAHLHETLTMAKEVEKRLLHLKSHMGVSADSRYLEEAQSKISSAVTAIDNFNETTTGAEWRQQTTNWRTR